MSTVTLDISEAKKQMSRLQERLKDEQLIWVTKHNKRAFAVVDMDFLEALLETIEILKDSDAIKSIQRSMADIRAGRLHDHAEIERELS